VKLPAAVLRLDGMTVQALIAGSLSFAHIHELANTEGQTGWKGWMYPLSVDLLMVAAWSRLRRARNSGEPTKGPWFWFLLALAASLAANVASCGRNPGPMQIAVAVWPAVAFLGTTLLGHSSGRRDSEVVPVVVPEPEPEHQTVPEPEPKAAPDQPEPPSELAQRRNRRRNRAGAGVPDKHVKEALRLLADRTHVSGAVVGEALGVSDSYGRRVLRVAKQQMKAVPEVAAGTA
jgi:hypothetical protein